MKHAKNPGLWGMLLLMLSILSVAPVWAHSGHVGPMVDFVKEKKALKTLLAGKGRKIVQRKEALTEATAAWVGEYFDEEADSGEITRFYVAKDRKSDQLLALAIVTQAPYHHGSTRLVMGIDAQGNVIRAAVLGVNEHYVADFEKANSNGWLAALDGIPLTTLVDQGKKLEAVEQVSVERTVITELKDSGVLLAAFLHQLKK